MRSIPGIKQAFKPASRLMLVQGAIFNPPEDIKPENRWPHSWKPGIKKNIISIFERQ
jgi:hypothetical protein